MNKKPMKQYPNNNPNTKYGLKYQVCIFRFKQTNIFNLTYTFNIISNGVPPKNK